MDLLHRVTAFLLLLCFTKLTIAQALTPDGIALLALKSSISADPNGALSTWTPTDTTPCHWRGVACNSLVGFPYPRVVSLILVAVNLSGTLPPEIAALDQLRRLSLHHNRLTGTLPPELFKDTALRSIFLQSNAISGEIPPQIMRLPFLQNLDLSDNRLYGAVPAELRLCRQLQRLVLARNFLSGPIPDGLGENLGDLQTLDLSGNSLSGPIPRDFGNLTSLEGTLNLSYNGLSGSIPETLGKLPYTVSLDFSHNNLTGKIPQEGSLADQGPGPFIGNPALCGFPLSRPCPTVPYVPPLPSLPRESSPPIGPFGAKMPQAGLSRKPGLSTAAIVAIAVGDAVGIALVGVVLVYFYYKTTMWEEKCCKKGSSGDDSRQLSGAGCCGKAARGGSSGSSSGSESSSEAASRGGSKAEQGELVALDKAFDYEIDELLRASAYVLGKSGLGIVYKVVLGSGLPFAVRRLGEGGVQRFKEFESEVQAIARVRHPHVVRLRAYYWADDEKLLIYDFLPNGSLANALHGQPAAALTWTQRLRIAKGAAAGLAYIHDCSPKKYVHGDIKASKILLDAQFQAYVADFGLARLATIAAKSTPSASSTATTSATVTAPVPTWQAAPAATSSSVLYRAPECGGSGGADGKPTQKWDVYAFGMVLLELLTGRSPAFQLLNYGEDLATWVARACKEDQKSFMNVLDPLLVAEVAAYEKQMVETLHVGVACTQGSPEQRPKMKHVVDTLDKLSPPLASSNYPTFNIALNQ